MIDLHTHTLLSDGELVASELARRAEEKGYTAIGLTDHVDASNVENVISGILKVSDSLNKHCNIKVIPGVEITHVPIKEMKGMVDFVRGKGIKLVVVHGETISEPVLEGTNKEGILSKIDILAHPGLLKEEDAKLAFENKVYLEITTRAAHAYTNYHVIKMARKFGVKLVVNSDFHVPGNLLSKEQREKILKGAGLLDEEIKEVFKNSEELVKKLQNNQ